MSGDVTRPARPPGNHHSVPVVIGSDSATLPAEDRVPDVIERPLGGCGFDAGRVGAHLPRDAPVARARRQGDSAQAAEQIFFQISGAGHEAVLVAAGLALTPGYDWFYPYYRDRALCLQLGVTPLEMLLAARRRRATTRAPAAGRCRRTGAARAQHRVAVEPDRHAGAAGGRLRRGRPLPRSARSPIARSRSRATRSSTCRSATARRAKASSGRRSTTAVHPPLPVLFLVEDNGYAISVPVEVQTPGGDISRARVGSFPGLHVAQVRRHRLHRQPPRAARRGRPRPRRTGPALVHAHVIRPYSHSLSDDEKLYKTAGRARGRGRARSDRAVPPTARRRRPSRPTRSSPRSSATSTPRSNARGRRGAGGAGSPTRRRCCARLLADVDPDVGRVRHAARSRAASPTRWSTCVNRA